MELYAKTELDEFSKRPVYATSGSFIVVRYGWYSYAFLRTVPADHEYPYAFAKAVQMVDALRALEE